MTTVALWHSSKFKISGFPNKDQIDFTEFKIKDDFNLETFDNYDIIINVSDFSSLEYAIRLNTIHKLYFWFPMNEFRKDIGLNSIYASLQTLYEAYRGDHSVLLHCFNGSNRSRLIEHCFYQMMNAGVEYETGHTKYKNRIHYNSVKGNVPSLPEMNKFLENCLISFQKPHLQMKMGKLDMVKLHSLTNF